MQNNTKKILYDISRADFNNENYNDDDIDNKKRRMTNTRTYMKSWKFLQTYDLEGLSDIADAIEQISVRGGVGACNELSELNPIF